MRLLRVALTAGVLTCVVIGLLIVVQPSESGDMQSVLNRLMEIVGALLGYIFFLGTGPLLLLLAGRYAKTRLTAILWGFVGAGVMAGVCLLSFTAAGIGSATSGSQEGYRVAGLVSCCYLVSVVVYFVATMTRLSGRRSAPVKAFLIRCVEGTWFNLHESQFEAVLRPSSFPSRSVEGAKGKRIEVRGCEIEFSYQAHGIEVRCKGDSLASDDLAQIVREIAENLRKGTGQASEVIPL